MLRRFFWSPFALAVFFAITPLQAQDPADAAIKGALQDLERFEQQVKGLKPNQKAGIKRVSRLLGLTDRPTRATHRGSPPTIA